MTLSRPVLEAEPAASSWSPAPFPDMSAPLSRSWHSPEPPVYPVGVASQDVCSRRAGSLWRVTGHPHQSCVRDYMSEWWKGAPFLVGCVGPDEKGQPIRSRWAPSSAVRVRLGVGSGRGAAPGFRQRALGWRLQHDKLPPGTPALAPRVHRLWSPPRQAKPCSSAFLAQGLMVPSFPGSWEPWHGWPRCG